jgi:hypothetical protein
MYAFNYRGASIQGYFDRDECRIVWQAADGEITIRECKSAHSAKYIITRKLRK